VHPFAIKNLLQTLRHVPLLRVDCEDLSLIKRFPAGERKWWVARWEVFNVFNHPNFQISANFRNYNETAAGYLADVQASGQGGPRVMQFALRYEF
jgi:hypothetical protein